MNLADLKRKPVVSMEDGKKIGEIDDLVLDPAAWRIKDLYVTSREGRGLLSFVAVKNFGPDAVTVDRATDVAWGAHSSDLCFEAMRKLIVVDGSGTNIGHIVDMRFEPSGAVESFEVHQGGVLGLGVHVRQVTPMEIRGIGDRLVTVDLRPEEPAEGT